MVMAGGARSRSGFRLPWRGMLFLLVVLLGVRIFLCTTLRVPTPSMEPCLHGDPIDGDSVLVFTPWYRVFDPKRWDLVVFERASPESGGERMAVKRVVALGGETVRIEDGKLWIGNVGGAGGPEQEIVKHYDEFRSLLVPLYRAHIDGYLGSVLDLDTATAHVNGATLDLEAPDEDRARVSCKIDPHLIDDGYLGQDGVHRPGHAAASDVLLELEVELGDPDMNIAVMMAQADDSIEFLLQPRAGGHKVEVSHELISTRQREMFPAQARQMLAGHVHRLEVWRVDGRVGIAIDGSVDLDEHLNLEGGPTRGADQMRLSFGAFEGVLRVHAIRIWRDLQYTDGGDAASFGVGRQPFRVPEGELFVLGDNSLDSNDSRHFGTVRAGDVKGRPLMIVSPISRVRWLH